MRRFWTGISIVLSIFLSWPPASAQQPALQLNDLEYFARPGINVMVFQDIYPEGHQGGVNLIQNCAGCLPSRMPPMSTRE